MAQGNPGKIYRGGLVSLSGNFQYQIYSYKTTTNLAAHLGSRRKPPIGADPGSPRNLSEDDMTKMDIISKLPKWARRKFVDEKKVYDRVNISRVKGGYIVEWDILNKAVFLEIQEALDFMRDIMTEKKA